MQVLQFEENGRTKRIERRVFVRCRAPSCGASLVCPDDADDWAWLKGAEVVTFRAEHVGHADNSTVGVEIKFFEKD